MQSFIYKSETTKNIDRSILKMREDFPEFVKEGSAVPSQKRYACVKLERILEHAYPISAKHGILLDIHSEGKDNEDVWLYASLTHIETGEFRAAATYLYPKDFLTPDNQQEAGMIITYQTRHMLRIFLGIISDEKDYDDGRSGKETYVSSDKAGTPLGPKEGCIDKEAALWVYKRFNNNHDLRKEYFEMFKDKFGYRLQTTYDIKAEDYDNAADMLDGFLSNKQG